MLAFGYLGRTVEARILSMTAEECQCNNKAESLCFNFGMAWQGIQAFSIEMELVRQIFWQRIKENLSSPFFPLTSTKKLSLVRPLPVTNFWHILAILSNVVLVFNQLIVQHLLHVSSFVPQLRYSVDRVIY